MSERAPGRRADYRKLDEIGFDVVDARLAQALQIVRAERSNESYPERTAEGIIAKEFGVQAFNLAMWLRRKRTVAFLAETEPEEILDMLSSGMTIADMALQYDVSPKVIEEWVRVHCAAEDIANAKDVMADMKFAIIRREISEAASEVAVKRALAVHQIDRHVAAAHSRRYSEDKNIRVNAGAGVAMQISFVRTADTREPEAE